MYFKMWMCTCDMKKLALFVLLVLNTFALARRKRNDPEFWYNDCGAENRSVIFNNLLLFPTPIITPGTLYISMNGNITRELPRRLSIQLVVNKYWIGIPFMLPCFNNQIGSCLYEDICDNLAAFERRRRCPKMLRDHQIQCYCPFHAGTFSFKNLAINIPKIGGFAGAFVKVRGDYGVTIKVLDESKAELGCVEMKLSLKKRNKGWLFRI
ncbi:ganglioside GM2 activator-like isoform X1 [Ostrea edulis]|uniref:ganglioside GM2 activator-like isoform X1 n=1 Tax=Ostrea edulis TaxID=37623 RepID=UPI0024AF8D38|nr:ganglioside GM2 activator-like isoform X1 [Ostrea edulis]